MQTPAIFAAPEDKHRCSDTVDSFLRVAHSLRSMVSTEMNELDLNEIRHAVLCFLQKQSAGCSQRALADELGQTESSISTLLRRMSADGLIRKTQSPKDARQRVLTLTDRGEDLATRAAARFRQVAAQLMREFSPEQHQSLVSAVNLLSKAILRMHATEHIRLTISRPDSADSASDNSSLPTGPPTPQADVVHPRPAVIATPLVGNPADASVAEQPRRAA